MTRRTLAGLILITWGGALGWLGARELVRSGGPALTDERTISPSAAFHTITVGDRQLGFASTTVDTVPTGLVIDDRLVLEFPARDRTVRADIRTLANLSNRMTLSSFTASVGAPTGRFEVRGTVAGDTAIGVTVVTEEDEYYLTIPHDGPLVLHTNVGIHLSSNNLLTTGSTVDLAVFDPVALAIDSLRLEVTADSVFFVPDSARYDSSAGVWVEAREDTVRAWRVASTGGTSSMTSWIDGLGQVVSTRSPTGPSRDRTAFEIAFNNFRARVPVAETGRVVTASAVAAGVGPPVSLPHMVVTVAGADWTPGSGEERQVRRGDTIAVTREPDSLLETSGRMPYQGRALARYVESRGPITADDPILQAQARQAVDGTRNPRRATQRLVDWVRAEIRPEAVPNVPVAAAILGARRGDVTDLALLYVAMSRAVGIPTRPVAGVVGVDGAFYFHAWAEVYLGRAWVSVDPTFGQFPAGANYVKLMDGSATLSRLLDRFAGLAVTVHETSE